MSMAPIVISWSSYQKCSSSVQEGDSTFFALLNWATAFLVGRATNNNGGHWHCLRKATAFLCDFELIYLYIIFWKNMNMPLFCTSFWRVGTLFESWRSSISQDGYRFSCFPACFWFPSYSVSTTWQTGCSILLFIWTVRTEIFWWLSTSSAC